MKEYPSAEIAFKVDNKKYIMKPLTLILQSRIEDENIEVTFKDVIEGCTSMTSESIDLLHVDQFQAIYADIIELSYQGIDENAGGEPKKQ